MAYTSRLTMQGHAKSDVSSLVWDLGTPADAVAAEAALTQLRGSYVDITKAFIKKLVLTNVIEEDDTRPADASADTYERAVISVYLTDGNKGTVEIYAPIEALFLPDGETVDQSNALLIQYIQQLSQHALVGRGRVIDTSITDGIAGGWKASVARSLRSG